VFSNKFWFYVFSALFISFLVLTLGYGLFLYLTLYSSYPIPINREIFKQVFTSFLLWELIVALSVIYLLYLGYRKHIFYRFQVENVTDALIKAFEHRLGNYLAVQKVNLSLLPADNDAVFRIKANVSSLEADLPQLLSVIRQLTTKNELLDKASPDILHNTLKFYRNLYPERRLSVVMGRFDVPVPSLVIKTIFDLLLANAFKYSASLVQVRLGRYKGYRYFAVRNDLAKHRVQGTGLGFKIISELEKEFSLVFRYCQKNGCFLALLIYKPPGFSRFFHASFFDLIRNR